ncbi:EVE domain-containing protein [Paeniglutamicibacter sp. ABSL32-1]|uniref:EVE domain-containing protein n=1 Tax=Paeniglutamicibacter quisquiliarum TaxID=2849498 RepID=UPI001C2DA254|nr:EVE domain-containing protein [Paeniglutamicibacter quisquiliarum]MBV1779110.1 EVE domain-containing protein [Paeniglutamicibacter quisquiliarum]
METTDVWLIQVDVDTVNELIRVDVDSVYDQEEQIVHPEIPEQFWPPADRSGTDPQVGDRLVLWQMGAGDIAGAVALGNVAETGMRFHDRDYHQKSNYHQETEKDTPRHSVRMHFTHWFRDNRVTRVELKEDPRFEGFVMFKRYGAVGKNPWTLTDAQWDAISERMPKWAAVDHPQKTYTVRVECDFHQDGLEGPVENFRGLLMNRDFDSFGLSATTEQPPTGDWDSYSMPSVEVSGVDAAHLVTWTSTVVARSAQEAAYIGLVNLAHEADDSPIEDAVISAKRYRLRL